MKVDGLIEFRHVPASLVFPWQETLSWGGGISVKIPNSIGLFVGASCKYFKVERTKYSLKEFHGRR